MDPRVGEEEHHTDGPRALTETNARRKALAVAVRHPGKVVLGADTIVVLHGKILGKPKDLEHARDMLRELGGQIHEVLTGVCLARQVSSQELPQICSFVTATRVQFHPLDEAAIETYLQSIDPLDKAGAYAAQSDEGRCIARIEGSMENVIGLPVREVREALAAHFPATLSQQF